MKDTQSFQIAEQVRAHHAKQVHGGDGLANALVGWVLVLCAAVGAAWALVHFLTPCEMGTGVAHTIATLCTAPVATRFGAIQRLWLWLRMQRLRLSLRTATDDRNFVAHALHLSQWEMTHLPAELARARVRCESLQLQIDDCQQALRGL